jgi:mono/diheme cytochrome c family protein
MIASVRNKKGRIGNEPILPLFVKLGRHRRPAILLALLLLAASFAACAEYSRGAKIFRRERCIECHIIRGEGGGVGPNLSAVGKRRSRQYIIEQIRNPKAHNPESAMPPFGHLPEQDINDLADYLSGLK